MTYLCIIIFTALTILVNCEENHNPFFPNLPSGKYVLSAKALLPCEGLLKPLIETNWYLSKTSTNTTDLVGNFTFRIPFDDSFGIHFNLAVKDSIGGWKNNAFVYKNPKACTTLKNLCGSEWAPFFKNAGLNNADCPIPKGFYIQRGYDLTTLDARSNFPKSFFYGTYKVRIAFESRKNVLIGCVIMVVEIKRPWENI